MGYRPGSSWAQAEVGHKGTLDKEAAGNLGMVGDNRNPVAAAVEVAVITEFVTVVVDVAVGVAVGDRSGVNVDFLMTTALILYRDPPRKN